MWNDVRIWIANRYFKIINSIAFYPALIGIIFLLFSYFSIILDFSETGKHIKSQLHWLSLKDASTARSIISSIVSGIISLTVFSFSMVMIILNQTASQMSNRILDKLIGNRFQQIVLGFYIGTIVFALFLLSTIRDVDSGIYVPALSTYVLILMAIIDIFLFIYFLHFITQSVKYEVIIQKIYDDTKAHMKEVCTLKEKNEYLVEVKQENTINAGRAGIYEGFDQRTLLRLTTENNCRLQILVAPGTFIFRDTVLLESSKSLNDEVIVDIHKSLYINNNESIEKNYFYGFRQLMEVAVKALSPGINDPGTAVQCLRALAKLFAFRIDNFPGNIVTDKKKEVRIITTQRPIEEMFTICILPIWDYGKNDRMIQRELAHLLHYLRQFRDIGIITDLYVEVKKHL